MVRCIMKDKSPNLTLGKFYKIIEEGKDIFTIIDNSGIERWYGKEHFKILNFPMSFLIDLEGKHIWN